MGLDMYLHAKKRFTPDSDEAKCILAAAGITAAGLELGTVGEPWDHGALYLSRWKFEDTAVQERSTAVIEAAGMVALTTEDSMGGYLRWAEGSIEVEVTAVYWRKANAIHGWFVRTVQAGIDECQESPVHPEQLALLKDNCTRALEAYEQDDLNTAAKIMEPTPGFFFGSYDINEWWAEDLKYTIQELDRVIHTAIEIGGISFSYRSSW